MKSRQKYPQEYFRWAPSAKYFLSKKQKILDKVLIPSCTSDVLNQVFLHRMEFFLLPFLFLPFILYFGDVFLQIETNRDVSGIVSLQLLLVKCQKYK